MTTALASVQPDAIQPFFSSEQERMILTQFLGGATKTEAAVLLEIVKRRRLDPFSRQVYFVKRWDAGKREEVWAIQTSIDGLRSIAERTGKYDGQDEPIYGEDEAGKFCKVKVYRKDWSPTRAAVGIAYLNEFIQKKKDGSITSFWARMPRLMLAKCAEALAIRKAFPEDAAGLYISEEMPETPERHVQSVERRMVEGVVEAVRAHDALPPAATLEPGVDPVAMQPAPLEPEVFQPEPVDASRPDADIRSRIAAATSLGTLVLLLNDIKRLPPPLNEEVLDAYRARREALKGSK